MLGPLLFLIYVNDISKASELFDFISNADDTTLSSQIHCFGDANHNDNISMNLSSELNKIIEWLKINKLSLNIKKSKFMIFHTPQKKISKPNIVIENIALECVEKFNCLGVILHQNMNWKSHIDSISSKIGKSIGVLNRLKHCLPI